jgi:2-methylisocitrate lyase-like PEP mutase family enzyme
MNDATSTQLSAIAKFHTMHLSGCFVLPNPWDIGTAVYLRHLGYKALATTSAGFAFTQGLPDTVLAIKRDDMLAHIRKVVAATPLPVNADFQTGYADSPEGVAANVTLCIATGVAGLSIEDAAGDDAAPLYEATLAVDRIRAARAAIDASEVPVVLTARCEAWLVSQPDPLRVAIDRLVRYSEAGADCLYAPGVSEPDEIAAIVKAVSPKPVNVLVSRGNPALSLVAWGAFIRAAQSIAATGSFDAFADAAPYNELNDLFSNLSATAPPIGAPGERLELMKRN